MWTDTALLLLLYWRLNRRERGALPLPVRIAYYVVGLAIVIFSGFIGYVAGKIVGSPALSVPLSRGTAPGLLLTLVMIGMLFVGFNQALRALFLSGDLERLLVAPVRLPAVMTAKLLGRLPSMTIIMFAVALPALITYGVGIGEGFLYYVAGVLLLLFTPLFGLSTGALIAMLLVRIMPAGKLNEYIGAAYIVLSMLVILGFQLPGLLADSPEAGDVTVQAVEGAISTVEGLPLPSMWAGQGLDKLGSGQVIEALGPIVIYLLITVGLFVVTVFAADRLYLSGWLRMQNAGTGRQGFDESAGVFGGQSLGASLAVKDWLLRFRDLRQLATFSTGIFIALFFAAFFILGLGRDDGGLLRASAFFGSSSSRLAPVAGQGVVVSAVILWIGWSSFSQVATNSLAMEGKSFYILKAAPIGPGQVLRAKLFSVFVPFAFVATVLLLTAYFLVKFSLAWTPYAWLCLLIIGYGLLSFSTAVGFAYANLGWDDPRTMLERRGRLYNLVGSAIYGLSGGLIAIIPFVLAAWSPEATLLYVITGLTVLVLITWLFVRHFSRRAVDAWTQLLVP